VTSRSSPDDLRASDADRERVVTLLAEAAGDGRLTLGEHSERTERAYSARTLGELAELTADLVTPAAQPIRMDGRRPVTALFGRDRRDGRWVVPERLAVTVAFGEVVLDMREALLQSHRTVLFATMVGGTLQLIVPDGVTVEPTGSGVLSRASGPMAARAGEPDAAGAGGHAIPEAPVIEVRTLALGGRLKVIRPRRSRWRGLLGRRS
jgi:Domain of unknown function (DUF1707)